MIKLTESDNPPMRLVLGEDALEAIREKIQSFQQELEEWEEVTLNTSFDDAKGSTVG